MSGHQEIRSEFPPAERACEHRIPTASESECASDEVSLDTAHGRSCAVGATEDVSGTLRVGIWVFPEAASRGLAILHPESERPERERNVFPTAFEGGWDRGQSDVGLRSMQDGLRIEFLPVVHQHVAQSRIGVVLLEEGGASDAAPFFDACENGFAGDLRCPASRSLGTCAG